MKARAYSFLVSVGFTFLAAANGCDTGLVGGECQGGIDLCGGLCVDLSNDEDNCGRCGNVCAAGLVCWIGQCTDPNLIPGDGSAGFGAGGRDGGGDGGDGAPFGLDGGDGGPDALADGPGNGGGSGFDGSLGDACFPPFSSSENCGACGRVCGGSAPFCAPVDGGFDCVSGCDPPLVLCGEQCADLATDPLNCGFCGHQCPTNLCLDGKCVGEVPGHIVAMCMDYAQAYLTTPPTPQEVLLGNAVLLPPEDPVRILAYGIHAPAGRYGTVNAIIRSIAKRRDRVADIRLAQTDDDIPNSLTVANFEVFLMYDQEAAAPGTLGVLAASWKTVLDDFSLAGGVVVVLGATRGVAEMDDFIREGGLFAVTDQTKFTYVQAFNRSPADAIGLNVLSPFFTLQNTCTFTTTEAPNETTAFVVTDSKPPGPVGDPVVLHRTRIP